MQINHLEEKLADVLPLVSLQLDHFAVFRVLNYSTITGKFLPKQKTKLDQGEGQKETESQKYFNTKRTFLKAFTSFFLS